MIVVNLFAGPGSGKSTTAAYLFSNLKMDGINCELVTEYAKDKVWDKHHVIFDDQIYIFAKQHHKQLRLLGQVDLAITDSPLLLSAVYNNGKFPSLDALVKETYASFNNVNVFIERVKAYNPNGRNQNKVEAQALDAVIKSYLIDNGIDIHLTVKGNREGADQLLATVRERWNSGDKI